MAKICYVSKNFRSGAMRVGRDLFVEYVLCLRKRTLFVSPVRKWKPE